MQHLLEVKDLKTHFQTVSGCVKAVDGISYYVNPGEIIGLVGESGCGKSVSQLSAMRLLSTPPGRIVGGEIIFEGEDLLKFDANGDKMRSIRGGKIAMIFQEPMTSLNPVLTIGRQLTEMLELHLNMRRQAARTRAADLLEDVGIRGAGKRLDDYPHMFSGGMRQRVMIAMAISCSAKLVIADEPTTAVDVTTQAQLLELLTTMTTRSNTALVIVTHNLGVVARYVNRLYVMYAGRIVESGTTKEVFGKPRHPYTLALLKSVPRLDEPREKKLAAIPGVPPDLTNMPNTCAFMPRCEYRTAQCERKPWPELTPIDGQHCSACYGDVGREYDEPVTS